LRQPDSFCHVCTRLIASYSASSSSPAGLQTRAFPSVPQNRRREVGNKCRGNIEMKTTPPGLACCLGRAEVGHRTRKDAPRAQQPGDLGKAFAPGDAYARGCAAAPHRNVLSGKRRSLTSSVSTSAHGSRPDRGAFVRLVPRSSSPGVRKLPSRCPGHSLHPATPTTATGRLWLLVVPAVCTMRVCIHSISRGKTPLTGFPIIDLGVIPCQVPRARSGSHHRRRSRPSIKLSPVRCPLPAWSCAWFAAMPGVTLARWR